MSHSTTKKALRLLPMVFALLVIAASFNACKSSGNMNQGKKKPMSGKATGKMGTPKL